MRAAGSGRGKWKKNMPVNDPVGDMLTRLRNASRAHHDKVLIPFSKMKGEIARCLKDEGYIADFTIHEDGARKDMTVFLKYGPDKQPVIQGIKRISRPGLRRYVGVGEIPRVLAGLGISILSTSRGVMVDAEARRQNVGGELVATVF